MDCRSFEWQVQSYIDARLPVAEQQAFSQHIASCSSCADLLFDIQTLDGILVKELTLVDPPAGFITGVMAALPANNLVQLKPKKRQFQWVKSGMLAAAVLLLALGVSQIWPAAPTVVAPGPDPSSIVAGTTDNEGIITQPLPTDCPYYSDITASTDEGSGSANNLEYPYNIEYPIDQADTTIIEEPTDQTDTTTIEEPADQTDATTEPEHNVPPVTNDPPPTVVVAEVPGTQIGTVEFPAPAYAAPQQIGLITKTLLAAHPGKDAILPTINADGQVIYYTSSDGMYYRWRQSLSATGSAEYVAMVARADLPSSAAIMRSEDASAVLGYRAFTALSPDGRWQASNLGGDIRGTFLINRLVTVDGNVLPLFPERDLFDENDEPLRIGDGGGAVLSWSADSNKLLFTDANGNLFAYYIAERQVLTVFTGQVTSAHWLSDNRTVLLSGVPTGGTHSNIYTVLMP